MSDRRRLPVGLLLFTLLLAIMLMTLSVPEWLRVVRPDMVAVLLIFWLIRLPESLGIGFAWTLGFVFDGISGSYLGQHALSFSFIAYIVLVLHQRIYMLDVLQQVVLVFFLLVLDQLVAGWVAMMVRGDDYSFYLLINALLGALCWPVMSAWLNRYQRKLIYAH